MISLFKIFCVYLYKINIDMAELDYKDEIWKDIEGYEGLYKVSNYSRIKSLGNGDSNASVEKILKAHPDGGGHLKVNLNKKGKIKQVFCHVIAAIHFIPNPDNKNQVHHIDGNKLNNHIDNLMWVTHKEHFNFHPDIHIKAGKAAAIFNIKNKSKAVNQYDLQGNFIKTWQSVREIERELGYRHQNIISCCNCKPHFNTAYGYIWKYA